MKLQMLNHQNLILNNSLSPYCVGACKVNCILVHQFNNILLVHTRMHNAFMCARGCTNAQEQWPLLSLPSKVSSTTLILIFYNP